MQTFESLGAHTPGLFPFPIAPAHTLKRRLRATVGSTSGVEHRDSLAGSSIGRATVSKTVRCRFESCPVSNARPLTKSLLVRRTEGMCSWTMAVVATLAEVPASRNSRGAGTRGFDMPLPGVITEKRGPRMVGTRNGASDISRCPICGHVDGKVHRVAARKHRVPGRPRFGTVECRGRQQVEHQREVGSQAQKEAPRWYRPCCPGAAFG